MHGCGEGRPSLLVHSFTHRLFPSFLPRIASYGYRRVHSQHSSSSSSFSFSTSLRLIWLGECESEFRIVLLCTHMAYAAVVVIALRWLALSSSARSPFARELERRSLCTRDIMHDVRPLESVEFRSSLVSVQYCSVYVHIFASRRYRSRRLHVPVVPAIVELTRRSIHARFWRRRKK